MESGYDAYYSSTETEDEEWNSGQDTSQSQSESSSSVSEQSSEASAEESQEESYSPVYSLGDMEGYTTATLSQTAVFGVCAGFAIAIGVALLAYSISAVMAAFKGIVTAGEQ